MVLVGWSAHVHSSTKCQFTAQRRQCDSLQRFTKQEVTLIKGAFTLSCIWLRVSIHELLTTCTSFIRMSDSVHGHQTRHYYLNAD